MIAIELNERPQFVTSVMYLSATYHNVKYVVVGRFCGIGEFKVSAEAKALEIIQRLVQVYEVRVVYICTSEEYGISLLDSLVNRGSYKNARAYSVKGDYGTFDVVPFEGEEMDKSEWRYVFG